MKRSVEVKERLRRARLAHGETQEQVGNLLSITAQAYSKYETGKSEPNMDSLQLLAKHWGVNVSYFFGETGQRQIPILGRVACGEPILAMEEAGEYLVLPEEILPEGDVVALRMVGDSMQRARLLDGDLALVKVQPAVEDGEIAAVCIGDDRAEATIKRFHRNDGFVTLTPDSENREHRAAVYYYDQVAIVGKVVGVYWG